MIGFGREFFSGHKVDQATFQTALDQFGAQHLVELTALMGHYAQTAFFLNAFEVTLPEERTEPVPTGLGCFSGWRPSFPEEWPSSQIC